MIEGEFKLTRRALMAAGLAGAGAIAASETGCGCSPQQPPTNPKLGPHPKGGVSFTDVTAQAGIDFKHTNGAFGQKWLPETMGSGLAWIDYDNDGYPDLFIVNSREWTDAERAGGHQPPAAAEFTQTPATCKLYHNNRDGTFTDVTAKAKLDIPMYGMGACVGDFNNDGYADLLVTSLTRVYLFRNNGDGTFTDITDAAGLKVPGWSTSAAFVDFDLDGNLDLFICRYVIWSPSTNQRFLTNGHPTYTTPQQYVGATPVLYRNNGNGTFTDVTARSGIVTPHTKGKSLGVAILDYDNDGKPDIAVANDTEPNYLYHNLGNGTFAEVGQQTGIAYPDQGAARGAMGIDACDYDQSGFESLAIGNFSNQQLALYHNDGGKSFRDVASEGVIGPASLISLSFGLFFFDMDNDGLMDLFVANGHVDDDIEETQKQVQYAEKPLLFRNLGGGKFADVSSTSGANLAIPMVARGAASADFDLDGFADIAVSTNNGPAHLFHNSGCANTSLRLELEGTKSNRNSIGALVTVKCAGTTRRYRVRSGSSYCSQSELALTIGLETATSAESVTIAWPVRGSTETILNNLAAGKIYRVVEGKGVVDARPFKTPYQPTHKP